MHEALFTTSSDDGICLKSLGVMRGSKDKVDNDMEGEGTRIPLKRSSKAASAGAVLSYRSLNDSDVGEDSRLTGVVAGPSTAGTSGR
jgi:hypothetical protein